MDGIFKNKTEKYKILLENWFKKVINEKLWNKFEDIHIDIIEPKIIDKKKLWLDFSLTLLNYSSQLINNSIYDILLVIPLSYTNKKTDLNKVNSQFIVNNLYITPPSIYLYPKKMSNFEETISKAKFINNLSKKIKFDVFFHEELEGNKYCRVLYFKIQSSFHHKNKTS